MGLRRAAVGMVAVAATAAAALAAIPAGAATGLNYDGSASAATIRPGTQTITGGAQCTADFLFTDGVHVFLGQAAHCSSTGTDTQTTGCSTPSLPLGTPVTVEGARYPGVLVYNSWIAMQRVHERDANTCDYNDFALVRLNPADVAHANPTVPYFGGPDGLAAEAPPAGATVLSYGNSELRMGLTTLSPKQGYELGSAAGGWTSTVYTLTPGIPGDSGSGFLTADGQAFGVLSTLEVAPIAGSNGVNSLADELAWLNAHRSTALGLAGPVRLMNGTVAFKGPLY